MTPVRWLISIMVAVAVYVGSILYALITKGPMMPAQLNTLLVACMIVSTLLAAGAALTKRAEDRLSRRIQVAVDAAARRITIHLNTRLDEIGEAPTRPLRAVPVRGVAAVRATVIDPDAIEVIDRITRRLEQNDQD